jgi:signal transduction histidine kinase/ActR/RegA family two-component response regulator
MGGGTVSPSATRTQLEGLLELTKRLTAALDTEEVARVVVDEAQAAVGDVTSLMWTVDDPPTHATLVRASGILPEMREKYARIPLEPWLPMGDAMLRREALFLESRAEFHDRYEAAEKASRRTDDLSYACLPLVAHGRSIGGVSLVFPYARAFDDEERMLLTVIAHHAAQALERASLFERETRTRRRLESLQQLTAALSSSATVEDVAELATRVGVEVLGFAACVLWVADEQHGAARVLSSHGTTGGDRETAERVARDQRPLWGDADSALPLVRHDRTLGVLAFSAGQPHQIEPDERAFMMTVADHCAEALARAHLHDDARSTKQLLQRVLERLPVGVIVSRPPNSRLVLSNDAVGRIWRTDSFPLLGEDRCKMLKAMYPDGRPMPLADSPVQRALRGEVVDSVEAKIERQDGTIGWIQASAAPVLRDDGSVDVAVATFVDVTAEKEARAAADEAGRTKDEFLAMLGHELRNPLTPIVTALELMDLRGGEAFRSERKIISRQVRHALRLVDDLLDISRITRGEILLQKESVEIAEAIESAIETASPRFAQRSQKLTVSVPGAGLPVIADPGRLSQAVANLLTNASKYTEPGGSITIGAAREDRDVCIRVRDTGIGIEPEVLAKVFDPFVQAKRSIDRSQGGLGLGLTIARTLVELNGGSLSAHSEGIGRGSEFVLRLPCQPGVEPPIARGAAPHAAAPAMEQRVRVLVVDDNADIADVLVALLEAVGCVTQVAYDGPSAIAALASFDAELALIDIGLPVMDGYALARHFRTTPGAEAMRLVAVTGYGRETDRQQAVDAGFDEHIVKPVELATIRAVLSRVLAHR